MGPGAPLQLGLETSMPPQQCQSGSPALTLALPPRWTSSLCCGSSSPGWISETDVLACPLLPFWPHLLAGPPGWTLALAHPCTALGEVNGLHCAPQLCLLSSGPAGLCMPFREDIAGTGVTSAPISPALQEHPALAVP